MSKREFKKYINGLNKEQLQEQISDLYERFKEVKRYYDFAFNPKEDKLIEECKFKISKEYFPLNNRKPKARRSIAQKQIKQLITLGVDPALVADLMLYNIELAQSFCAEKPVSQDAFYISMLKSYKEAIKYIHENGMLIELKPRLDKIIDEVVNQKWFNILGFESALNEF
jgi:hypothetical protein